MDVASPRWIARRRIATAAVLAGQVVAAFEGTVVTSAMPTIVGDLGGMRAYGWVFSSFLVASAVAVLVCGKLADAFGRLPVFAGGMTLFLLGSSLCGASTSFGMLVAFRAVQGLGAGALTPIAMTITADLYTLRERANVQALLTSTWGAASLLGPLIGGWLVLHASWRWVFFVNLPVGAAALALLAASYRDPPRRKATGHAAAVSWRAPAVRAGLLCTTFAGGTIYVVAAYVPLWVAADGRGDALHAGAALLPFLVGWALGSTFGVRFLILCGMRTSVAGAFGLALTGAVAFAVAVAGNLPAPVAMGALALLGLGIGPATSISLLGPQSSVPWDWRGAVTSAVYAVRTLGGLLAVGLLGETGDGHDASVGRFGAVALLALAGLGSALAAAPRALAVAGEQPVSSPAE